MAIESEMAVIGGILADPQNYFKADLAPADFADAHYRTIYAIMQQLADRSEPVDIVTVLAEMPDQTYREAAAECMRLAIETVTVNFSSYVDLVKDTSIRRQAAAIGKQLIGAVESDGRQAIETAVGALVELSQGQRRYSHTYRESVRDVIEDLDLAFNNPRKGVEVTTGFTDLDKPLGGWAATNLIVVGARPSIGKTAFAINSARRCNAPCGFVSAEQDYKQIGARGVASEGGVSLERMRSGAMLDEDWPRLTAAVEKSSAARWYIYDKPGPKLSEVIAVARAWKVKHGIRVLFVDYLQRIQTDRPAATKTEAVGRVAMALKNLARDLDIAVVALAQVKREVENRNNKRPLMGDLSDSSEIEKEADQIVTMYRDDYYNADSAEAGVMELLIAKNRHGPTGTIRTAWSGECVRLENLCGEMD